MKTRYVLPLRIVAVLLPLLALLALDAPAKAGEPQAAEFLFVMETKVSGDKSPTFLAQFVLSDDGRFVSQVGPVDGDIPTDPWLRGRWLDLGGGKIELEPENADEWLTALVLETYPGAELVGLIARPKRIQIRTNGKGASKVDAKWTVYWSPSSDSPALVETVKLRSTEEVTA